MMTRRLENDKKYTTVMVVEFLNYAKEACKHQQNLIKPDRHNKNVIAGFDKAIKEIELQLGKVYEVDADMAVKNMMNKDGYGPSEQHNFIDFLNSTCGDYECNMNIKEANDLKSQLLNNRPSAGGGAQSSDDESENQWGQSQ